MREKEGEKISKILFKKVPTKKTVRLNIKCKDKSEMKKRGKQKRSERGGQYKVSNECNILYSN